MIWVESATEEFENLVAGGDGRLSSAVNEMHGHHTVWEVHVRGMERRGIAEVSRFIRKHSADESLAKPKCVRFEACAGAVTVARKAVREHGEIFAF